MQLTMIGGGGFRVPQMYRALAGNDGPIDRLVLTDTDERRLAVVGDVIRGLAAGTATALEVRTTTDVGAALDGADFVFSAIRVGGTRGRVGDEEIALRHGLLGQETVGVGGLAYALRTVPVARTLAAIIDERAPGARVINFTNPAGIITQAMRETLGDRVIGICDTPIGLVNRVGAAIGRTVEDFDYVGVNHLGWLRSAIVGGRDVLPALLEADAVLGRIAEAELFGHDVVASMGALPNEYLFFYWSAREAVARIRGRETRGRYLDGQQEAFYAAAAAEPWRSAELWRAALGEREATYGGEAREDPRARRAAAEIALGGYQPVALQLMETLAGRAEPSYMILDVANAYAGRRAIAQLPDDAVVEVPCLVDADGVHPRAIAPVSSEMAGLMVQVKACDELVLRATAEREPALALRAFAAHPLVDSLEVARAVLAEYCARVPGVAAAIGA